MMTISKSFFDELHKHCTAPLLDLVKDVIIQDCPENTWDITSVINGGENLYEQMRVAYAFEQLGGQLRCNNQPTLFVLLAKRLDEKKCDCIRLYWEHNNANGVIPIYDIVAPVVPPILPRYVSRPDEKGGYVIERLTFGRYESLNGERYQTERIAQERAAQLNAGEDRSINTTE